MALRSFPQVHHPASAMARHRSPRDRPPMSSGATFTLQEVQRQDGRPCFSRRHIICGGRQLAAKLAGCHACPH